MWKDILKKIAPTIGAAIGGPFGGMATKFVADKLLGKPDATETEIEEFISSASPDQLLQLKELNTTFKLEIKRLGIKEKELNVEDRKSARDLFKVNIWPQITISAIFIIGYFIILKLLLKGSIEISPQMFPVAMTIIGVMTAAVTSIIQFWFGSSSGSKQKTAAMSNK